VSSFALGARCHRRVGSSVSELAVGDGAGADSLKKVAESLLDGSSGRRSRAGRSAAIWAARTREDFPRPGLYASPSSIVLSHGLHAVPVRGRLGALIAGRAEP